MAAKLKIIPSPAAMTLAAHDEVAATVNGAAETYARVRRALLRRNQGHLDRITTPADRLMRDLGITFSLYRDEPRKDHIVPFDPFPRVIDPAQWQLLSRGIAQRVAVWNAFFRDIYDSQEVLKAKILPFEIVYDDPHYQRAAVSIPVPQETFIHVAAFDLARNAAGHWMVVEDYVSNTTGASYALQCRHVLSQVCPELLTVADILPVHGYPTELLEHLRGFAHGGASEPRVVLLSPGIYNEAYYEHSYLARMMGIPLVQGGDLIVLNNRVYLKTIGGLEPIDVIYRRMDDAFIDPVAFREDSQLGVPGLMSCVRKGTVTVANAVGSGLGENRALAAYLPKLAKFYFNEPLLLPNQERLVCLDPDQCELVLSNLGDYVVASAIERSNDRVWFAAGLNAVEQDQLRKRISTQPGQFVAEPWHRLSLLPACVGNSLQPRHAGLRLFALGGKNGRVFPCALTRFALQKDSRVISSGLGGGIKDTWILRGEESPAAEAPLVVSSPPRRLRLGSRIADSLFWMGRYSERAENTTRILKVLQQIQLEEQARGQARTWATLWEALARATGHATHFFKRSPLLRERNVSHYILLDRHNPSSVLSCLESCRRNTQGTRESVPPEVWVVINRLYQQLLQASTRKTMLHDDEAESGRILELQDEILNQLDALSGCAAKTMLHDDGWHFWRLGAYCERAQTTVLVMNQVLLKCQGETGGTHHGDPNLDALLRMLSCQYAYRSLFQSRPALQSVALLLLQDTQLPRSLLYCLEAIRHGLQTVFGQAARETGPTPLKQCSRMISEVSFAEPDRLFARKAGRKTPPLHDWLAGLSGQISQLATAISDHYLHHQAFNILR